MITVDIPARMTCVEKDCAATAPVSLYLQTGGGFAFKPDAGGWQILASPNNPMGPVLTRCPAHHIKLQVGAAGPRIVHAGH